MAVNFQSDAHAQSVDQIHERILHMQRQLERETIQVTVGGVTVEVTGCQRIHTIHIAPDMLTTEGAAAIAAALTQAVNAALDQSRMMAQAHISTLTHVA